MSRFNIIETELFNRSIVKVREENAMQFAYHPWALNQFNELVIRNYRLAKFTLNLAPQTSHRDFIKSILIIQFLHQLKDRMIYARRLLLFEIFNTKEILDYHE